MLKHVCGAHMYMAMVQVLVDEVAGKDKGPPQPRESATSSGAEGTAADTKSVAQVPPVGGNPDVMPGAQGQSDPSACAVHPAAPGAYPAQPVAAPAPGAYPAQPVAVAAPGAYPAQHVAAAAGGVVGYPPGTYAAQPAVYYPQPGGNAVYMSAGEIRRAEKERRKIEKKAEKERRKAEKEARRKEDVESIVRGIKNIF